MGLEMKRNRPVTISRAELAFLDAIIEYQREEETGEEDRVTVYLPTDAVAFWAKAAWKLGKWAYKNRGKLAALATAATDLLGGMLVRDDADYDGVDELLSASDGEFSLKTLIGIREEFDRQVAEVQRHASEFRLKSDEKAD